MNFQFLIDLGGSFRALSQCYILKYWNISGNWVIKGIVALVKEAAGI